MKLLTKRSTYVSSNCELRIGSDLDHISAFSYGWWKFVTVDTVGNVIFNDYSYSVSTRKHQSDVYDILRRLGIRISLTLYCTDQGFQNGDIKDVIDSEIRILESHINEFAAKKSWKKLNQEKIKTAEYRIKDLKRYRDEYIDKKRIKLSKKGDSYRYYYGATDDSNETFKKYFRKPNGKLQRNEYNSFVAERTSCNDAPNSIDKLKTLLEVKKDILFLLLYKFTNDLENMLPDVDSKEYRQLQSWLKNRPERNILLLDKIHTYLINKMNRKEYTPAEPSYFTIQPKLERLKGTEDLRLIETDHQLRAEGRKQSHCIGGKNYIEDCENGYQALNYKGYTFFLNDECDILETSGRHNRYTPESIRQELAILIRDGKLPEKKAA